MNRENKRKQYEKSYYKTHACADSFTCKVCGRLVVPAGAGTGHRNHCPNCLSGIHAENEEGLECGGILEPVGIWVKTDKDWEIIQRCSLCQEMTSDPMSADDSPVKVLSIASKPLSEPVMRPVS